ncbi:MAG: retropepsin-like aspartic protease [Blastocatellales bacterium]
MKARIKSKFLTCAAVFISSLCALATAQTLAASTTQFKLVNGYMIVIPVTVNGAGPYEFLLDTGTNTTLISEEFARALRLRPIDRVELVTVAGSRIVPRAKLESVVISGKTAMNLEALFSDLREARAFKPEIHGVLGMNFLAQFNFMINYRERRIEFEDEDELEKSLRGARLPMERNEGRALITSAGKERLRLVLDSGTPAMILFNSAGRASNLSWEPGDPQWFRLGSDLGGRIAQQKRLRGFIIGGVEFCDLPVILCDTKDDDAVRAEDGLLPTCFFQQVYFNWRKSFVILNRSGKR